MIRLDTATTTLDSTIDEFDPLGEAKCQQTQQPQQPQQPPPPPAPQQLQQQSNPGYCYHVPRQKAEPQVAMRPILPIAPIAPVAPVTLMAPNGVNGGALPAAGPMAGPMAGPIAGPMAGPAPAASYKGYSSRFNPGSDPFSDLLAFTRTNYGPSVDEASHLNEPKDPSQATNPPHTWTKFD